MSLFTRARRHVDMKRVKELREEKIKEEKIAEVQKQQEEILAGLKQIEIKEDPKYSNWRRELKDLSEMTTVDVIDAILPPDPNTIKGSVSDTSLSSSDNDSTPDENGVVVRIQSFERIDASKTDTLTVTIDGSFMSKTIDGFDLTDKVSIGVLVNGTYAGNYLAQNLGAGTHTLTIPAKFRNANVRFDAIQSTAFDGESGTVNISGIGVKRVNAMPATVRLDDPEINSFIRMGDMNNLSAEERKAKLKDMLDAGNEYLTNYTNVTPSQTAPGDIELASIYQSPDGTYHSFPGSVNPNKDTSKWPSINDKPKPVKWPTPGIFPGQLPRV